MKLPFTTEQFFNVIEKYNEAIFPSQLIILLLAFISLISLHSKFSAKDKITGLFLGILWIWTGVVYHLIYFTAINKAAFLFGLIFILQGLLILFNVFGKNRLNFNFTSDIKGYSGYFLILYGLIIYPIISYFTEGSVGKTIVMGLPCPSTIFTLGFFILTINKFPKYLLIIPSIWAVIGVSAAINIGVFQDLMIIIAAITANILLLRNKKNPVSVPETKNTL